MTDIFTNNTYPFKHWLTSIAVSSVLLMLVDIFTKNNTFNDAIGMGMLLVLFGFIFSLPVFIIYLLLFNLLLRITDSPIIIKAALNSVAIIGVFITIKLIGGTMMTPKFALYYSLIIIVCSLFYKIQKQIPGKI